MWIYTIKIYICLRHQSIQVKSEIPCFRPKNEAYCKNNLAALAGLKIKINDLLKK